MSDTSSVKHVKDFDSWNKYKKKTNQTNIAPKFTQGQVWWVTSGIIIDYTLVLNAFIENLKKLPPDFSGVVPNGNVG